MRKVLLAVLAAAGFLCYATASQATDGSSDKNSDGICIKARLVYTIYAGSSGNGGGKPFTSPQITYTTPDIQFATTFSFGWHPLGLGSFGAQFKSYICVPKTDKWLFGLYSDDGSQLYIDGNKDVDNGNSHGPTFVQNSVSLTAGTHPIEVDFFECCGGPSGVDLFLPKDVKYGAYCKADRGDKDCAKKCAADLVKNVSPPTLQNAAANLGYPSVDFLNDAISEACEKQEQGH